MARAWSGLLLFASSLSLLYGASLFKVTSVLGSSNLIFSGINIVGPLCGAWLGMPALTALFFARFLLRAVAVSTFVFTPLVYHIPTFCAAASFRPGNRLFKLLLIGICCALFLSHPHGAAAWWFSLYWLIPAAIILADLKQLFWVALSSTFIAHAVGSVIWLYWFALSPEVFWALMPLVPLERVVYACGMVIVHTVVSTWWMQVQKISQLRYQLKPA